MFHGALVGVINFLWIVAAAMQPVDIVVAHISDQFQQLRISAKELLADVGAALVLAVYALFHPLQQKSGGIACQQAIPVAAPDHFDHIPAGPAKGSFQLVDDLAVAAHRAVQALEIAVHDENEIV